MGYSDVGTLRSDLATATVTQTRLDGLGPVIGEQKVDYENVGFSGTGGNQFTINTVVTSASFHIPNAPQHEGRNGYVYVTCGLEVSLKDPVLQQ